MQLPQTGLPTGLTARHSWRLEWQRVGERRVIGVAFAVQPFESIRERATPGTLLFHYWSWQLSLSLWARQLVLFRFHERTALQVQLPR